MQEDKNKNFEEIPIEEFSNDNQDFLDEFRQKFRDPDVITDDKSEKESKDEQE